MAAGSCPLLSLTTSGALRTVPSTGPRAQGPGTKATLVQLGPWGIRCQRPHVSLWASACSFPPTDRAGVPTAHRQGHCTWGAPGSPETNQTVGAQATLGQLQLAPVLASDIWAPEGSL